MSALRCMNEASKEFPIYAETDMEESLNGDSSLSLQIVSNKDHNLFINDINKIWQIKGVKGKDDDTIWRIIHISRKAKGRGQVVGIKAKPAFFDDMDTMRIYERFDRSYTAFDFFTMVFGDTKYSFNLMDNFSSLSWEGIGEGESRLEIFKRGIERYEMEFEIVGDIIHLYAKIERKQAYMFHHRLNASDITEEADSSEFWTHAKGFGNYENDEGPLLAKSNLKKEYTSPLAAIVGKREAPPIINGNITVPETMRAALETLVNESVKVSVTANVYMIKNYPYPNVKMGDTFKLIDKVIGFNTDVRAVGMSTKRDVNQKVKTRNVTLGDKGVTDRHKSNIQTAAKMINDLQKGRKQLPPSFLDQATRLATKLLLSANTELNFDNGIVAVDKDDPNNIVLFNAAGLGVSNDGGLTFKNAITGAGITATVINSGVLNTGLVKIEGADGLFVIDGDVMLSVDANDPDKYVRISPGHIFIEKGGLTMKRPDNALAFENGLAKYEFSIGERNPPRTSEGVYQEGPWWTTESSNYLQFDYMSFKHSSRYLRISLEMRVDDEGNTCSARVRETTTGSSQNELAFASSTTTVVSGERQQIVIDLGIPTFHRRDITIDVRSVQGGNKAKIAREFAFLDQ